MTSTKNDLTPRYDRKPPPGWGQPKVAAGATTPATGEARPFAGEESTRAGLEQSLAPSLSDPKALASVSPRPAATTPLDINAILRARAGRGPSNQGQRALSDVQELLTTWQAAFAQNPSLKLDKARANELMKAALLPFVPAAGADLVALCQAQLGTDTKQAIASLLDGTAPITDEARGVLSAAIGRVGPASGDGRLQITGDQSGEKLRLTGVPGAQVEAINLSTIPTKRITPGETFVVGSVGSDGKFEGNMPMRAGDQVRVRLRLQDGTTSDWVDLRAQGLGDDTRNAEVALFRIGLVESPAGSGSIAVSNINASRTISEPGAVLRFVNQRTNTSTDLTINKDGTFDPGTKLPGKTGDTFSVRVTDGMNDTALTQEIATVTVGQPGTNPNGFDLPDPALHKDELDAAGNPRFSKQRFTGPLFGPNGARAADVLQGQIGNCYLPAAVAAIAQFKPGFFEQMIKKKESVDAVTGEEKVTYQVTFQERTFQNGVATYKPRVVEVDGDLYVRSFGGPLYGSDDGTRTPANMEMWWPILEKAYAQWKGSYNAIGDGGFVDRVFEDVLGLDASSLNIGFTSKETVWDQIVENVDAGRPIGLGTYGHDRDALYANTGVYSNHAYSIFAHETAADGTRYVQVRNPWGESEPFPGDGKNDGVFKIKLEDLMKLYQSLYFVTQD